MQIFILIFMIALAITMWGQSRFRKIYGQELEFTISSRVTGAELVERMLKRAGIDNVSVVKGRGILDDFYSPEKRQVSLSPQHFNAASFAALGMAAQQAGKAIQHVEGHKPLFWRTTVIRWTVYLSLPLIVIGLVTLGLGMTKTLFPMVLLVWSLIAFANVATIPTELDAGERAKRILEDMKAFKNLDERVGVERVMGASSTAYLSGFAVLTGWASRMIFPWFRKQTSPEE
ncbi:zinc metallopeptidase [Verrucomicrobiales bacterium]|nr:zinc metallopeptidase [Verrucomicrobiales bacterium]